jgi:hypothetical protein
MALAELKTIGNLSHYQVNYESKIWELDLESRGDSLFLEALLYKSLELIDVGKHISCFMNGSGLHIHFRRNLDQIKPDDSKSDIELARAFSDEIGADLSRLSELLSNKDPRFEKVETIIGLCGLGAAWGRKHGWETKLYTQDPILIKLHESTIENKPINTQPNKLTIFTITREQHIQYFPPPAGSLLGHSVGVDS